jgi:hypothetical protein
MKNRNIGNNFKSYSKEELISQIDSIEITKQKNQVITKFKGNVVNVTNVSDRYEVFDISSFIKSKIESLEENFNIKYYKLRIFRGIQELTLLSDKVMIDGKTYYKSFFILSSSNRMRALNMNMGLYRVDNNTSYVFGIKNLSLYNKHLTGVTQKAEEKSTLITDETFVEQIESIESLVGEKVMLSKLREVIIDKDLKINHRKFDAFKNNMIWSHSDKIDINNDQKKFLMTRSEDMKFDNKNDIEIDAFKAFNCYIQVFSRQDSYVIKKETQKIMNITKCFIRNQKIEEILYA